MKKSNKKPLGKPKVAIIMGSTSDRPIMMEASRALKSLRVPHEVKIVSAHRTPQYMYEFSSQAEKNGIKVIIAGAGGAAHLPGMVASLTSLPVIGVPITVGRLKGLDALLSIAQMPKGVPVACVAIDNAYNAGLLAARILSLHDGQIRDLLVKMRTKKQRQVLSKNKK